jgi:hypothetical protein
VREDLLAQLEAELPDVDQTPVPSERPRRWRGEVNDPVPVGRCQDCGGQHVADDAARERIVDFLDEEGATRPCRCACC